MLSCDDVKKHIIFSKTFITFDVYTSYSNITMSVMTSKIITL